MDEKDEGRAKINVRQINEENIQKFCTYKFPKGVRMKDYIVVGQYISFNNRQKILKSRECGCYYCLKQFFVMQITQWWDEDENGIGQTAVCPFCWIDSVIGDDTINITEKLLKEMREYWFSIAKT